MSKRKVNPGESKVPPPQDADSLSDRPADGLSGASEGIDFPDLIPISPPIGPNSIGGEVRGKEPGRFTEGSDAFGQEAIAEENARQEKEMADYEMSKIIEGNQRPAPVEDNPTPELPDDQAGERQRMENFAQNAIAGGNVRQDNPALRLPDVKDAQKEQESTVRLNEENIGNQQRESSGSTEGAGGSDSHAGGTQDSMGESTSQMLEVLKEMKEVMDGVRSGIDRLDQEGITVKF